MEQFSRTELLLGKEAMKKLADSRVAVFGLGGVGGYAAEALARSGVGSLDLIDNDKICPSNINRQIFATFDTVGMYKTDAAQDRIKKINPDCVTTKYCEFFCEETKKDFPFEKYDFVVDAIDTVSSKIAMAVYARDCGTPIISSMGAGNKLDPCAFKAADIYDTRVCPLARVMRRELRKRGVESLRVVYSEEDPIVPLYCEKSPEGSSRRQTPGSTAFVPSVAGLIIAGEVVRQLIKQ